MTQRKVVVMPESEIPPGEVGVVREMGAGPVYLADEPVSDVEYVCGSCDQVLIKPPAERRVRAFILCSCGAYNFADVRSEDA